MIKKAKKYVAVGLSVALAVTSVNIPVNSASAAAKKAKLSATKKTLTAGKSTTLTLPSLSIMQTAPSRGQKLSRRAYIRNTMAQVLGRGFQKS